ncbi:RNA-directed DNA polymerase, eukaryota, reverse transcriptase zinc-binding domain protein [Tanacetum coccineum]
MMPPVMSRQAPMLPRSTSQETAAPSWFGGFFRKKKEEVKSYNVLQEKGLGQGVKGVVVPFIGAKERREPNHSGARAVRNKNKQKNASKKRDMFSDELNEMSDLGGGKDLGDSSENVDNGDKTMEDDGSKGSTPVNQARKENGIREEVDERDEVCLDERCEVCLGEGINMSKCNSNDKRGVYVGKEMNENITAAGKNENKANNNQKTYAKMVTKDLKVVNNNLDFVPTVINEEGSEFIIFDEALVEKRSAQWKLTVCGHFIGYRMSVHELRYNIRRMWSKWGIDNIDMKADGTLNNKPLFVQKWDPTIGMEKVKQTKVPLWVTLVNLPMEAWSTEGISALASSLGKPLIMDNMTARRFQYIDSNNNVKGSKQVKVEYAWKPEEKERDAKREEELVRQRIKENKKKINYGNGMENKRFMDRRQNREVRFYNVGLKTNENRTNKGDVWRKKDENDGKFNRQKNRGKQVNEKGQNEDREKNGNKYDILNGLGDDNDELEISKGWKNQKEINKRKEDEERDDDMEDVLESNSEIAKEVNT